MDFSYNAAAAVPSSPIGTWKLIGNQSNAAMWIGTGLSSASYTITITCTNGSYQEAVFVPVSGVAGNITNVVTGAASGTGLGPPAQSPTVGSMILGCLGFATSAQIYISGGYSPPNISIFLSREGFFFANPVKAGTYNVNFGVQTSISYSYVTAILT